MEITVRAEGDKVLWIDRERTLAFPTGLYVAEVQRAQRDTTWETLERSAARLVRESVDRDALSKMGLTFEWASGRIADGKFTVSLRLEPGPYQVLTSVPLAHETPEELAESVLKMLQRDPRSWMDVSYIAQKSELGPPKLSGPGWVRWGGAG